MNKYSQLVIMIVGTLTLRRLAWIASGQKPGRWQLMQGRAQSIPAYKLGDRGRIVSFKYSTAFYEHAPRWIVCVVSLLTGCRFHSDRLPQ